jgi:hypothetical protein
MVSAINIQILPSLDLFSFHFLVDHRFDLVLCRVDPLFSCVRIKRPFSFRQLGVFPFSVTVNAWSRSILDIALDLPLL